VLAALIVGPAALVVVALFLVMWREHRSPREAAIAAIAGAVLAVWATLTAVLAARGVFLQPDSTTVPPIGVALVLVIVGLTLSLVSSESLRRLLTNQKKLIRLNVWRLVGLVFLLLMAQGQMPALWALPAGIGDVIVGATAFWVAGQLDTPGAMRRAIIFNWFGLADLVVAVGLGMMTSLGPTRVFHTTPTSELATHFPLVLVPAFLVPLAFTLHVISLWQLFGWRWVSREAR
jgi:hypothetical protein